MTENPIESQRKQKPTVPWVKPDRNEDGICRLFLLFKYATRDKKELGVASNKAKGLTNKTSAWPQTE